nr:hypothetical protein FVER53263_20455 [Fusarium verticillioides]
MVSTPPPSDDAEGHPPEESPHDEEEAKSASPSKKEAKQPKTSNRGHKLRHKQPAHYRTHTNDFSSQESGDPVMRQAMRYGVDPNTYRPPPPGAYPPNANPSYYPSPNLPPPAGYPNPYTYPGGGGYFSTPRASVRDPQYFSPPGYDVPPSGYSDPGFAPADSYGYEEEIPPYPEYPTPEPKRAPVRPRILRQPKPQTEPTLSSLRRDAAHQRPRRRRPSVPTRETASPEDGITMQDIMAELRNLQRQLDTILEYLELQGGWEDEPAPQRLRESHERRPQPLVLRGQPSVASGSSVHVPSSPTLSRATPRRRQTLPSVIRPPQDAQPSNQGRTRQGLTRLPEPDDEDETYGEFRRPARTRVSSTQSVASQDKRRLVQRSDARPPERKIVEGDQQKVRPGRFAYVQTEDEEDEEPARAPVPPYPVPDPPGQSRRRKSVRSVRFD